MKKIAVVIVTYKNSKIELEKLEKSIMMNGVEIKSIYFLNNIKENLGYAGGINRILKKILSKYNYFFIVNPDVVLHKNCIARLVKILKNDTKVGIVGPKIVDNNGRIWSLGGELDKKRYSGGLIGYGRLSEEPKENIIPVDFVSGTVMLIKK